MQAMGAIRKLAPGLYELVPGLVGGHHADHIGAIGMCVGRLVG